MAEFDEKLDFLNFLDGVEFASAAQSQLPGVHAD
jgi:hypothetical protein